MIEYRALRLTDVSQVSSLFDECFPDGYWYKNFVGLRDVYATVSVDQIIEIVAIDKCKIVGYLMSYTEYVGKDKFSFISTAMVSSTHRRCGLYHHLSKSLWESQRKIGAKSAIGFTEELKTFNAELRIGYKPFGLISFYLMINLKRKLGSANIKIEKLNHILGFGCEEVRNTTRNLLAKNWKNFDLKIAYNVSDPNHVTIFRIKKLQFIKILIIYYTTSIDDNQIDYISFEENTNFILGHSHLHYQGSISFRLNKSYFIINTPSSKMDNYRFQLSHLDYLI